MKKILLALMFLSSVSWAQGDVSLPICQRPSICGPIPAGQLDKTVTTQGNAFNGASELVQLLGNGKLPALDGSNLYNISGGGSSATPGGLDTQVQFNQGGVFAGAPQLRYDYTNDRVQVGPFGTTAVAGLMVAHTSNQNALVISDNSNSTIYMRILNPLSSFGVSSAFIAADDYLILSGGGMTGGANISMKSNGRTGIGGIIIPGFTLDVGGQVNTNDRFSSGGTPIIAGAAGEIQYNNGDTKIMASSPNLVFDGTTLTPLALSVTGNISSINTVPYVWPVVQGSAGFALINDGAGNLSWAAVTTPVGGADTQLLFNSGGVETGSPNLTYNGTAFLFATDGTWHDTSAANTLTIDGSGFTLNGSQMTATMGAYTFNDGSGGVLTMNSGNLHYHDGTTTTNFNINNDGIQVQVPQGTHFFTGTDAASYNLTMHYDNGTNMDVIQDDGSSAPGLDFLFSGSVQFDAPIIANQATALIGNLSKIRNVPYTWPTVQGVASTVLQNNGSGGLSWSQIPTSTFTAGAVWFKYTFSYSDFATASNQNSVNLVQLPAGGVVQGVKIKQSTAFSGGSISSYTVSVGIPGANDKYASGFDVFQATGPTTYQLTNTFNSEDNDSPAQLTVTATDGGDTLDNASAGTVDVWLLVSVPSGVGYTLNLSTNALNGRMGAFLATANLAGLPKEFARTTIDESPGIKVVRVSISALTAGTGGTSTVFRVSDGSTNLDTSLLTGALNATATFSQNYPTGTILKIIEQSSTNTTKPTGINVMVQYSKQ